jgi:hypothetical protein
VLGFAHSVVKGRTLNDPFRPVRLIHS